MVVLKEISLEVECVWAPNKCALHKTSPKNTYKCSRKNALQYNIANSDRSKKQSCAHSENFFKKKFIHKY